MSTVPTSLVLCVRYSDPRAAIDWLCSAFGFSRHFVVEGEDEEIAHAQLTCGSGMVMIGPWQDDEFGAHQSVPEQFAGKVTASAYVVVEDVDAHHDQALAAGARIVIALRDEAHGGRAYSCRDQEGHLWTFGSYDPWASGVEAG
jgi:uncharacterized glyoxalase superfamily protein PhnB